MPTIPTPSQHSLRIPSQSNRQKEEIKAIQIGKEQIKLSLTIDDMILYLKDKEIKTLAQQQKTSAK
jgi:hypothetical protein